VEALSGFTSSEFKPHALPEVTLSFTYHMLLAHKFDNIDIVYLIVLNDSFIWPF
jgi:hypothetical protein